MTGRFFIDPTMIAAEPDGIVVNYAGIEGVPGGIDLDPMEGS